MDLYLHWKSCYSSERLFSAVCQTGSQSRKTGLNPEDSTCLEKVENKVFEFRYHLEQSLNSRDIMCPMKVAFRRGLFISSFFISSFFLSFFSSKKNVTTSNFDRNVFKLSINVPNLFAQVHVLMIISKMRGFLFSNLLL